VSPHPGCIKWLSFICFCQNLFMQCCTILEIVPFTQLGSSSFLSLPSCGPCTSSSSSFPFSPSLEHARLLRLSSMVYNISTNIVPGFLAVSHPFSVFFKSSCSCFIAVSASSTHFLATAVSLSTHSSIHFSFCSLLKKFISSRFSAVSFCSNRKPHNVSRVQIISASMHLLQSFA